MKGGVFVRRRWSYDLGGYTFDGKQLSECQCFNIRKCECGKGQDELNRKKAEKAAAKAAQENKE